MTETSLGASKVETLFGLAGKVAIVTGAASGIGKGIAELFVQAGARVVIADLDGPAARRVALDFAAAAPPGAECIGLAVDVIDEASVVALFDAVRQRFGRIDVLVNNAGIYFMRNFFEVTAEEWDRIYAVNVRGTFFCLRQGVKAMRERGQGGSIVNISTCASLQAASFDNIHYATSKAAVNNMTRVAALEFAGDNIRVNAILPGAINTEGGAKLRAGGAVTLKGPLFGEGRIPMIRRGEPADIARTALYLASDASNYVTGELISVDGGFHIS
jgi:NAD(P)-dependent dehydrogenase (short-subunit alcohol dehydrogenase family)